MKRIKVLHSITRLIIGGAQENTVLSAQLLDKDKYEVDVICGAQLGREGSLLEESYQRNVFPKIFKNLVREINPIKDFIHLIEMIIFLKKNNYTIIHTHSSKAGFIHRIAAKIVNVPIIIHTVHGWSFHNEMSKLKRKVYVGLEKIAAKFSNKIITVTDLDIKKGLKEKIGREEQYKTIHSSIEVEKYEKPQRNLNEIREEFNIKPDDFVVGTVARLAEQKAPLDFMKIAYRVSPKIKNIKFLYVGDGHLRKDVEKYIRKNGLEKKVILAGLRTDVPDMLAVMDIFILTSLWEGLPRVFSQAMAAKLPIIATKVAGAPEAIIDGKNGHMTTPGKPMEMIPYIEKLYKYSKKRELMGEFGYKIAHKHFSVYSMIKDIEDIYEIILKEKNLL